MYVGYSVRHSKSPMSVTQVSRDDHKDMNILGFRLCKRTRNVTPNAICD